MTVTTGAPAYVAGFYDSKVKRATDLVDDALQVISAMQQKIPTGLIGATDPQEIPLPNDLIDESASADAKSALEDAKELMDELHSKISDLKSNFPNDVDDEIINFDAEENQPVYKSEEDKENEDLIVRNSVLPEYVDKPQDPDTIKDDLGYVEVSPFNLDNIDELPNQDIPDLPNAVDIKPITNLNLLDNYGTISDFTETAPNYTGTESSDIKNFSWVGTSYSSTMWDKVEEVITEMLNGTTGIPDETWDLIWGREQDRENKATVKAIQEVRQSIANLGFTMPTGIQVAREDEINQKVLDTELGRSRDLAIERVKHEVENLKHAVVQGLDMERLNISLFQEVENRLFEVAKVTFQAQFDKLRADIDLYNLDTEVYKFQFEVHRVQLEEMKLKLEADKLKIESAQAQLGYNESKVKVYMAEVEAVNSAINSYRLAVEKAELGFAYNKQKIEEYNAYVETNLNRAKVHQMAFEIKNTWAQALKTETELDAQVIENYLAGYREFELSQKTRLEDLDAVIKEKQFELDVFKTKLQKYQIESEEVIKAQQIRVQGANAQTDYAKAMIQNYTGMRDQALKEFLAGIENTKLNIENTFRKLELELQAAMKEADYLVEATKMEAQIGATIGGSYLSGLSVSAQISDSANNSFEAV
jgi:hypothetical protein